MIKDIDKIQEEIKAIVKKYKLDDDETVSMLMLAIVRHGGDMEE